MEIRALPVKMFVLTKQGNRHLVSAGFVAQLGAKRKFGCLLSAQIWAVTSLFDETHSLLILSKTQRIYLGSDSVRC